MAQGTNNIPDLHTFRLISTDSYVQIQLAYLDMRSLLAVNVNNRGDFTRQPRDFVPEVAF